MKQYFVVLKDQQGVPDFMHPTDIMGESAQQIRKLMSEDTPAEYIQGIYTPQEYLQFIQSKQFINLFASFNPQFSTPQAVQKVVSQLVGYIQSFINVNDQSQASDDAFAAMVGGSTIEENFEDAEAAAPKATMKTPPPAQAKPVVTVVSQPTKYFTEAGIKFKLENGELYKKEWTDEPIEPYMDKVTDPKTGEEKEVEIIPDFRLVNKETGKPVKLSKYVLQQAVWKKLES